MSTTTTTREDYDQTSHQEMMFDRLVKSQEDMFSRLETLLSNVLASQQQTLEILICNNTAKDQDDSSAENQQEEEDVPDSNSDNDDDYLIFEDEEITEVPADDEEEDQRKSGMLIHASELRWSNHEILFTNYLLGEAEYDNWKDATEYLKNNREQEEWKVAMDIAVDFNQLLFLEEIFKIMPPDALQYNNTTKVRAARCGNSEAA
ncbi:hypothetical protein C5167_041224 [Papaver somniferum]|uniref:Uncharacterized protein n=1 Tax=Papaver somniferum TaxID=3469 RepID=A0A4Y7IH81_PAPSO|nr:hypothetical protein C5167_041224 [Papaver somniferum]